MTKRFDNAYHHVFDGSLYFVRYVYKYTVFCFDNADGVGRALLT